MRHIIPPLYVFFCSKFLFCYTIPEGIQNNILKYYFKNLQPITVSKYSCISSLYTKQIFLDNINKTYSATIRNFFISFGMDICVYYNSLPRRYRVKFPSTTNCWISASKQFAEKFIAHQRPVFTPWKYIFMLFYDDSFVNLSSNSWSYCAKQRTDIRILWRELLKFRIANYVTIISNRIGDLNLGHFGDVLKPTCYCSEEISLLLWKIYWNLSLYSFG